MKVDIRELALLIVELFELEDLTKKGATPDGRWDLLQAWLKTRPRWQKKINRWVDITPDEAYAGLCEWVSHETALPLAMLKAFISAEIEGRIKGALSVIQTLYRQRANEPRKLELIK